MKKPHLNLYTCLNFSSVKYLLLSLKVCLPVAFILIATSVSVAQIPKLAFQKGVQSGVSALTFFDNGNKILLGDGKTVRILDGQNLTELKEIKVNDFIRQVVSLSNSEFVVLTNNGLRYYDASTGSLIKEQAYSSRIDFAEPYLFEDYLIINNYNGPVSFLHSETGKIDKSFTPRNRILSIAINFETKEMITGDDRGNVELWDLTKEGIISSPKKEIASISGGKIGAMALSPDGKSLAFTTFYDIELMSNGNEFGNPKYGIQIYNTTSYSPVKKLIAHGSAINKLIFWENNSLISLASDNNLLVWDVEKVKFKHQEVYQNDPDMILGPGGEYSFLIGNGYHLWSMNKWEPVTELKETIFPVKDAALFNEDKEAVIATLDKAVYWNLEQAKVNKVVDGFFTDLTSVDYNKSTNQIVVGGEGYQQSGEELLNEYGMRNMYSWTVGNEDKKRELRLNYNRVSDIISSKNHNAVVSIEEFGAVNWYDLKTNDAYELVVLSDRNERLEQTIHLTAPERLLFFTRTPHYAESGEKYSVSLWDFETADFIKEFELNKKIRELYTNRAGDSVYALGEDKVLYSLDSEYGSLKALFSIDENANGIISEKHRLFIGTTISGGIYYYNLDTGVKLKEEQLADSYVTSKTWLNDDTLLLSTISGGCYVVRLPQMRIAAEISLLNGGEDYITVTSDLYYTGSKNAVQYVKAISGDNAYSFEQLDLIYNRPDKVLESIGLASGDLVRSYKKAWEKRINLLDLNPDEIAKTIDADIPTVSLKEEIDQTTTYSNSEFSFSILAESKNTPLSRLFVSVNGVPLYGKTGLDFSKKDISNLDHEVSLILSYGINSIKFSVLNSMGVESLIEQFEVSYKPLTVVKPNLHVIAIGVSEFEQNEFNLTYADKDANDLIKAIQSSNLDFEEITVHALTNEQATKENVLALRDELEQTKVDDQVIVFAATHGLLDDNLDYYLAMHGTDFANPSAGSLRYDELEGLIDRIPARNKLMLLDACHSGEVDKEETELGGAIASAEGAVKSRGFRLVKAKKDNGVGLKSSFELMKELFADLRRNNGAAVISSASGQEFAFESSEWKNGVFTYSLLEGLKSGKADLDKDGNVKVSELREYVSQRVQKLTNGQQNPTSRAVNLENDFRIW